ncbi:hypothetical protein CC2G_012047 [Coprinopsis cinerea AmutBmut pab1-1]|nr:hypothetical protein CC2G_012047 [Coprinopsis cinerea AmutBmut pab1-1]
MSSSYNLFHFQLTSSLCSAVAILSTSYRLFVRRSKLWIDDVCAFCSMLALCVQMAAVFTPLSSSIGVARYYLMITTFYVIVWFARLSILFSIIRIDPSKLRRKFLYASAFLFLIVCGFMIAQLFFICSEQPWREHPIPQCHLTRQVAITQLIFNTLSDLLLLVIPLQLLVVLQDRWLRSRLMVIFSTCTITTMVSMVHAVFILTLNGPEIMIVALIESSVSIIVANVPVIATAVLHLGGAGSPQRSGSRNSGGSGLTGPLSIRFLTGSHAPTSTTTTVVQISQPFPLMPASSLARLSRTLPARPSSVLLKPEDPVMRLSSSLRSR